jgi:hypothetical protein
MLKEQVRMRFSDISEKISPNLEFSDYVFHLKQNLEKTKSEKQTEPQADSALKVAPRDEIIMA